jgi:hypothetical protein
LRKLSGFSEIEFRKAAALCSKCKFGDDDVVNETPNDRAHLNKIFIAPKNCVRCISVKTAHRISRIVELTNFSRPRTCADPIRHENWTIKNRGHAATSKNVLLPHENARARVHLRHTI